MILHAILYSAGFIIARNDKTNIEGNIKSYVMVTSEVLLKHIIGLFIHSDVF